MKGAKPVVLAVLFIFGCMLGQGRSQDVIPGNATVPQQQPTRDAQAPQAEQQQARQQQQQPALTSAPQQQQAWSAQTQTQQRPCIGYLLGLGTQKGGTSSAWRYLYEKGGAHPRLRPSDKKELNFFGSDEYSGAALTDYHDIFKKRRTVVADVATICPLPGSGMLRAAPRFSCSLSARRCSAMPNASSWGEERVTNTGRHGMGSALPTAAAPSASPAAPASQQRPAARAVLAASPPLTATAAPGNSSTRFDPFYFSEVSPLYLFDHRVPARVFAMLPEARLFMILRNPVDRAVSAFNMFWQKKVDGLAARFGAADPQSRRKLWAQLLHEETAREIAELEDCYRRTGTQLSLQPELYKCLGYDNAYNNKRFAKVRPDLRVVHNGIYADALERWFSLFSSQHFLVWNSDDFKQDSANHIRQLIAWLGLNPADAAPDFRPKGADTQLPLFHKRAYGGSVPIATRRMLHRFYVPHNERLFRLLRDKGFAGVAARLEELWQLDG